MSLSKAEEKTEKMKAKSGALDEMIDSGVLWITLLARIVLKKNWNKLHSRALLTKN